jgi:two-component system, chemotaxis family, sensor kinase Cph1
LFQNLLANGLKFHRPGEPPQVHVSALPAGGAWQFTVSDNGIGIEPQYLDRIFVLFQRLHTRAEYPGTGIGLAICKKIVERHGGTMHVTSSPGHGTTFTFTLPATRADGEEP